jgi:hypothetical protein
MFQLLFFKKRRVRTIVDQSLPTLERRLRVLPSSDRAATLAVANAMIVALSEETGLPIANNPKAIPQDEAVKLISGLAESHIAIVDKVDAFGEKVTKTVVSQMLREAFATELVMVTASVCLDPDRMGAIRGAWRVLYEGRTHAHNVVPILGAFMKETGGTSPLPSAAKRRWKTSEIVALASSVPPFLRPKKTKVRKAA